MHHPENDPKLLEYSDNILLCLVGLIGISVLPSVDVCSYIYVTAVIRNSHLIPEIELFLLILAYITVYISNFRLSALTS